MRALKIVAEGVTTSFRYPHFVQGTQPTFEMPPPATIYGHVCSALGYFFEPDSLQFGYNFTWRTKFFDYEHTHIFSPTESKLNPFQREILYAPKLTLYLDNPGLYEAFISPHYPVVLGRSQDLMTYTLVKVVDLEQAEQAFFCDTLLPLDDALWLGGRLYAVTMPRYITPERQIQWGQYAVLSGRVDYPGEETFFAEGSTATPIWVDPEPDARHPYRAIQKGVMWHRWV